MDSVRKEVIFAEYQVLSRLRPAATKEDKITCQKNPSQGPDLKPELPEFEARMWATLL